MKDKKEKLDVVGALYAQLLFEKGTLNAAGRALGWKGGGGFKRYTKLKGGDEVILLMMALAIKRILRNNAAMFDKALALAKESMVGGEDE